MFILKTFSVFSFILIPFNLSIKEKINLVENLGSNFSAIKITKIKNSSEDGKFLKDIIINIVIPV